MTDFLEWASAGSTPIGRVQKGNNFVISRDRIVCATSRNPKSVGPILAVCHSLFCTSTCQTTGKIENPGTRRLDSGDARKP